MSLVMLISSGWVGYGWMRDDASGGGPWWAPISWENRATERHLEKAAVPDVEQCRENCRQQ